MYHASSSSSRGSMAPASGLTRYGSAPDSFLSTAVDSAIIQGGGGGATLDFSAHHHLGYFSSADTTTSSVVTSSESACQANPPSTPDPNEGGGTTTSSSINRLQRSYGFNEIAVGGDLAVAATNNLNLKSGGGGGSLVRHSSSPAGFLNHHHHHLTPTTTTTTATAADNAGFPVTRRRIGSYNSKGVSDSGHAISRLNSQLSFTREASLSHISEESENVADGISADNSHRKAAYSYVTGSFGMGSWDDTDAIVFSAPPSKRTKNISGDVVHCLDTVESQFSLPQTAMEMATMEMLLQIPQDSVPCKIGAKRGCATHPRSIAERERRTRISGKLKKLQELVPNMDKQTSYADMLDLAVHHIKGLQNQVQKLNNELEDCKCGCKQTT